MQARTDPANADKARAVACAEQVMQVGRGGQGLEVAALHLRDTQRQVAHAQAMGQVVAGWFAEQQRPDLRQKRGFPGPGARHQACSRRISMRPSRSRVS